MFVDHKACHLGIIQDMKISAFIASCRFATHFCFLMWLHTVNSGSEMVGAKHVSGKNIYWSTCIGKSKERKIFDFLHCPFEPPAKQHRPVSQLGWILWCMLARPSKGQCRNSKIFPPLLLTVKVDQNIFFPETCFASTISEPEFTVCNWHLSYVSASGSVSLRRSFT